MTALTIPDHIAAQFHAAAEVVTGQLTPDSSWTIEPEAMPTEIDGGRVVVALAGNDIRIGLIMASLFARGLIVGPPPADSLEEALEAAFKACAETLVGLADGPRSLGTLSESTVAEAITSLGGLLFSYRLLDGDAHVATLILTTAFDVADEETLEAPVFEQLPESVAPITHHGVSMLADVEMGVTVELGRAKMSVAEILSLTIGSVIELDRLAGSPVDVLVNGTLIARGEVVVVDEEFGVRVSEVLGYEPTDRNRR